MGKSPLSIFTVFNLNARSIPWGIFATIGPAYASEMSLSKSVSDFKLNGHDERKYHLSDLLNFSYSISEPEPQTEGLAG